MFRVVRICISMHDLCIQFQEVRKVFARHFSFKLPAASRVAACRLIDLMPGNEKWVIEEAQHGSSSHDQG